MPSVSWHFAGVVRLLRHTSFSLSFSFSVLASLALAGAGPTAAALLHGQQPQWQDQPLVQRARFQPPYCSRPSQLRAQCPRKSESWCSELCQETESSQGARTRKSRMGQPNIKSVEVRWGGGRAGGESRARLVPQHCAVSTYGESALLHRICLPSHSSMHSLSMQLIDGTLTDGSVGEGLTGMPGATPQDISAAAALSSQGVSWKSFGLEVRALSLSWLHAQCSCSWDATATTVLTQISGQTQNQSENYRFYT